MLNPVLEKRVKQVSVFSRQTAVPLWFVNAVLADVSEEHSGEKKNPEALKQFHFQKSVSFVDRSALTE